MKQNLLVTHLTNSFYNKYIDICLNKTKQIKLYAVMFHDNARNIIERRHHRNNRKSVCMFISYPKSQKQ